MISSLEQEAPLSSDDHCGGRISFLEKAVQKYCCGVEGWSCVGPCGVELSDPPAKAR
jgi:hypothetical protein